jgi:putative tryptophan/tyrosine transport system substrate-binding protein
MKRTALLQSWFSRHSGAEVTAPAQQTGKIFRIGFLDVSTASSSAVLLEVFRQEMRKLGWIEEKNITIEYRFADQKFERLPELAEDLVRLKVDLIVAPGSKIHFPIAVWLWQSHSRWTGFAAYAYD